MNTRIRKQLPPNCHIDKGKFVRFQKQIKGKRYNINLGHLNQGIDTIYSRYREALRLIDNKPKINTFYWLINKFINSEKFKNLANGTQSKYITSKRVLEQQIKLNGIYIPLGQLEIKLITKPFMHEIMDKRLSDYKDRNLKGEAMINYEVALLSSAISWGLNHVSKLDLMINPLAGIEKLKAPVNERYVTHAEYTKQYNLSSPLLRAFFEVCYLCACRSIEVRNLTDKSIEGDKLLVKRTKGSKHTYIMISPRLKLALDSAKSLRKQAKISRIDNNQHIFVDSKGYQLKRGYFKNEMAKLKRLMGAEYWTAHQLKSKGLTDAKDKNMAGLTEAMKKRYIKFNTHEAVE
jgi:integrase